MNQLNQQSEKSTAAGVIMFGKQHVDMKIVKGAKNVSPLVTD